MYIVTAMAGLTPFSRPSTLKAARLDSNAARRQGLEGEIWAECWTVIDILNARCILSRHKSAKAAFKAWKRLRNPDRFKVIAQDYLCV